MLHSLSLLPAVRLARSQQLHDRSMGPTGRCQHTSHHSAGSCRVKQQLARQLSRPGSSAARCALCVMAPGGRPAARRQPVPPRAPAFGCDMGRYACTHAFACVLSTEHACMHGSLRLASQSVDVSWMVTGSDDAYHMQSGHGLQSGHAGVLGSSMTCRGGMLCIQTGH